jgi:hypothetical protein
MAVAEGLNLALQLATLLVALVVVVAWIFMERDRRRIEAASRPSRLLSGLAKAIALRKSIDRRQEAKPQSPPPD